MDCCDNQKEVKRDGVFICENCLSLLDALVFEDTLFSNETKNNIRFNKFFKLIFNVKDLPWYVRNSMLDLFPKIENYFFKSERVNFINMNQLSREMCRVLGYPDFIDLFPPLKTKARVKQVGKFVDNAVNDLPGSNGPLIRLEDMSLIRPVLDYEIDMSKVPLNTHIYSDRPINIYA
jgi:hypothetical protein